MANIVVLFEIKPTAAGKQNYLDAAPQDSNEFFQV